MYDYDYTIRALIISAMDVGSAYHRMKAWGYSKAERHFVIHFGSNGRIMTGNIYELWFLLLNPTMMEV